MPVDADRLIELEIALTHQEATLRDLSDIVRTQADQIDLLRALLDRLALRLAAAEAALPDDAPEADRPPPHW
ncbi:SlyX family protein [Amaricoccus sp.]|uniref:SlyX family protein n=1 Tax=Amaricoccus sp. TaxID=1872485 RepID=UPI002604FDE5|nr:SlyX family protein [uncultured Amaricoccus sp.]